MSIADKLTQIAENEQKVYNAGYEKGKAEAEPAGDSHYDTFWDAYQQNGQRTNYSRAFNGMGWNDTTFAPKYDIIANAPNSWTYSVGAIFEGSRIENFDGILKKQGVVFKANSGIDNLFDSSYVTNVTLDCDGLAGYYNRVFAGCSRLKRLELQNIQTVQSVNWFVGCTALEDLSFTGTSSLGGNVNVSACVSLTHDSLMNIIYALATITTTQTLTLGTTNLAKLTEQEIAVATEKGWTVV